MLERGIAFIALVTELEWKLERVTRTSQLNHSRNSPSRQSHTILSVHDDFQI